MFHFTAPLCLCSFLQEVGVIVEWRCVWQHRAVLMHLHGHQLLLPTLLCSGVPTKEGMGQPSRQQRPIWEQVSSSSEIHWVWSGETCLACYLKKKNNKNFWIGNIFTWFKNTSKKGTLWKLPRLPYLPTSSTSSSPLPQETLWLIVHVLLVFLNAHKR